MADKENENIENGNKDGNENVNENENGNGNGNQEHDLDSILGNDDYLDGSEEISKMLRNSETLNPELDAALSQFVDDGGTNANTGESEIESEDDWKKKQEEEKSAKIAKIRKIKKVSIISVLAVFVISAGLISFYMINKYTDSYALTYKTEIGGKKQSQKINIDDFKFIMSGFSESADPVSDAAEVLKTILTTEKAAADRSLTLSDEEISSMKAEAADWKNKIDEETPHMSSIATLEFIERYVTTVYLYQKLGDGILDETGWTLDEEDYALGFADFKENNKADYIDAEYKYIRPETEDAAAKAKAAIDSGEMSVEEAFQEYYYNTDYFVSSMYGFESLESFFAESGFETMDAFLNEYGYDEITLYDIYWFEPEDINHLAALSVGEVSRVIEYSEGMFILLALESIYIPATDDEISEIFMPIYRNSQIQSIFPAEFEKWLEEFSAGIKVNYKAVNKINMEELLGQ